MSFNIHSTGKDDFCSYCDKVDDCPLCEERVRRGYCNVMEINRIRVYRYLDVDRNGVESDWYYLLDDFDIEKTSQDSFRILGMLKNQNPATRFLTSQDIKGREVIC